LSLLEEIYPDSRVCIARELTKIHEEYLRGKPSELIEVLRERGEVKGEVVLLIRLG